MNKRIKTSSVAPEEVIEKIQSVYGMVRWNEILDKNGIDYDKTIMPEIIQHYSKILDSIDYKKIDLIGMVRIIYINEKMGIRNHPEYITDLGEYYDENTKLFCKYRVDSVDDITDLYTQSVQISYIVYRILGNLDLELSNYEITSGLAKYYNSKNIDEDVITDIIYLYEELNVLDMIDVKKAKNKFQSIYDNYYSMVGGDETYTPDTTDFGLEQLLRICDSMDIDTSGLKKCSEKWVYNYENDDAMFPFGFDDLLCSSMTSSVYWDVMYHSSEIFQPDKAFYEKFSEKYSLFYNECLKGALVDWENGL